MRNGFKINVFVNFQEYHKNRVGGVGGGGRVSMDLGDVLFQLETFV